MLGKVSYQNRSRSPHKVSYNLQSASPSRSPQRSSKWVRTLRRMVAMISLTIGCIVLIGFVPSQQAKLRQSVAQADQLLQSAPVESLVTAIQATGQNRDRLPWKMLPEVESSLLNAVQNARERNRFEQAGQIYTATFAPDQRVAAAGEGGQIYLWEQFPDPRQVQTQILQGNGEAIGSIAFSPNGSAVLGNPVSADDIVQFWQLQDDSGYQLSEQQGNWISAAFSSDGQRVISRSFDGRVQLWNAGGEWIANLYPRQAGGIGTVAFDGGSIVSGGADGNITLWDTKGDLQGRLWAGAEVNSLQLDQGGQRIISQDHNRQQAFVWDVAANQWNQFLLGETDTGRSATLSPDNGIIARGNQDGSVQLLPLVAENRQFPARSLIGHRGAVNTVSFSADGKTIASGGEDGTVRLWDVWDGTLLTKYHLQQWMGNSVEQTVLSPDGETIALQSGETIRIQDIGQNVLAQISDDSAKSSSQITFTDRGETVVLQKSIETAGEAQIKVSLWNRKGEEIGSFLLQSNEAMRAIQFSPDGQYLASLGSTGNIQLWNRNGQPLGTVTANPSAQFLVFSPNGQWLLSGGGDVEPQTCLWQIKNDSLRPSTCHSLNSRIATFSPDQRTVAIGSEDGQLYRWNLRTGRVTPTTQHHTAAITSIAFNADGTRLISGSADGQIRLSDAQGEPIGLPFIGHAAAIQSLAFSPNNETIVSLGQNGEVRVWQANWRGWLETACHRLQYHPVLRSPNTPVARGAKATCQQYVESFGEAPDELTNAPQLAVPDRDADAMRLVVKLGERRVHLYHGDTIQASYPLAIGKAGWETPTGTFRVFEMLQNPAWTHPITRERMGAGTENPLGTRWIGFWSDNYNKIGFHGTPDRNSVGQDVSHGCLRMYDEDVQALYEQVQLGTPVVVMP
ncbi:L,D-transpeptidase family protein [Egbenema bharatensis]|uniref:L,D-transpeptidase family protein n=1 Tax=Egbenema bharatensis TaxID=3463334 RepID=UPI003A87A275